MPARIALWSALATLICTTALTPGYAEENSAPDPQLISASTPEEQASARAPEIAPAATYQPPAPEAASNKSPALEVTAPQATEQATAPQAAEQATAPQAAEQATALQAAEQATALQAADAHVADAQAAETAAPPETDPAQTAAEDTPAAQGASAAQAQAAAPGSTVAQGKSFDDTLASFSAEERPKRSGPLAENNLSTAGGIIKWLLSTIAILGVIVLFAFLLKKSRLVQRSVGPMCLEAQMAVGPKERVVQLQVGKRHILLGVTANNVNFLMDLTEPDEPEAKPTAPYTRAEFDRFAAQFMAYMQEKKAATGSAAGNATGAAADNAAFSAVFAQAYDRTTQAAQAAGLMDAAEPTGSQAAASNQGPADRAVNTAEVIAALKDTPWVADTELAPDDSETLPPLPEGLTKGTTPEEIPAESAKDKSADVN